MSHQGKVTRQGTCNFCDLPVKYEEVGERHRKWMHWVDGGERYRKCRPPHEGWNNEALPKPGSATSVDEPFTPPDVDWSGTLAI